MGGIINIKIERTFTFIIETYECQRCFAFVRKSRESGSQMIAPVLTVRAGKVRPDKSEFGKRYEPSHPAADADGYVLTPNVNSLIEMTDMREAQRSYEAKLNVIKASKAMLNLTIDVLR